jgi:geranylgeranyl diphosphate synthase, type II
MSYEAPRARSRTSPATRRLIAQLHERALRSVLLSLPSTEPRRYLYDLLPLYPQRAGRGLRPILCMAACEAYGGSYDDALPLATALELLHNAFLVHDDIQDGSARRRGRPALHVEHGLPLALNVGDALAAQANALAAQAVQALPVPLPGAITDGWERMVRETLEGQAIDLGWTRDNVVDVPLTDYLEMCGKKTAWYTSVQPLAIGAILGSGSAGRQHDTFQFAWFFGLLFQVVNDLIGLQAPAGEDDISEGKRTIALTHLLGALAGPERAEVLRVMGLPRDERGPAEVSWVRSRMEREGSIEYVVSCVRDLAAAARSEADRAFGPLAPSGGRDILLSITGYVLEQSVMA